MSKLSSVLKTNRCPFATAVIVAGGSGTRFGGDKLMAELCGEPVLVHTLRAFQLSPMIQEIVLVTRENAMRDAARLCKAYELNKVSVIVAGGATRVMSSYAGVMAASGKAGIIAIHDGARPLVTEKIIEDTVWEAYRHGSAVPAVPVRDTIKVASNGIVTQTPDRSGLFAVQTPQCFQSDLIRAALIEATENAPDVTDDCMAVERVGGTVHLTEGSEENLKITTPLDLSLAEIVLKGRTI